MNYKAHLFIRHIVVAFLTLSGQFALAQQDDGVTRIAQPRMILNPPNLAPRAQAQLATAAEFKVFNQFGFTDRIHESGIRFQHRAVEDAAKTYKAVHYDHGNGLAVADVDGDGLLDVLFVTQAGGNELWRNLGKGKFENITEKAGIAMADRISVGASFADIDNDGDADLYITAVRSGNLLFENLGKGEFRNITEASGTGLRAHSSGVVFFDYDRDGLLDMFVCNVGQYTSELIRQASNEGVDYTFYDGFSDAFSGHLFPQRTENSVLYHNLGNNRFEDVTAAMGITDGSWSGDASAADLNGDGWPDLYLLNMQGHDQYFENQQGEGFINKRSEVFPKTSWGAMGIRIFDWNNDGLMDVFVTDMHSDMSEHIGPDKEQHKSVIQWDESHLQSGGMSIYGNSFFQQQADGSFTEISGQIGAENYWPWGLSTGDLNADGYQDAFLTSSMNYPFRYGVNSLLLNEQGQRFRDAEFILGVEPRKNNETAKAWFRLDCDGIDQANSFCENRSGTVEVWGALGSRSSALFDLDDDGDLDIVTNEFNAEPMVLISDLAEKKPDLKYLKVSLQGSKSNRAGIGARVEVKTDQGSYVQVNDGKSGYLSQSQMPLYFGLGSASRVEEVRVIWPAGTRQITNSDLHFNQLRRIVEP
ncbi:MAG: CRTAC1 family protein [Xanthomonadales bacterium]|nr:CRTAC1 family protein [Xanthomonadales bacterium]